MRNCLSLKLCAGGRKKLTSILIISLMIIPSLCDKTQNLEDPQNGSSRSNGIDRRKSFEEDQNVAFPTAGCGSCKMREELKNRNLEVIKGEVLKRMGFQAAPNVTGRVLPYVPQHMLAKLDPLGGMQSDEPKFKTGMKVTEEEDDYHVKTETVLTFAQQYPRLRHSWRGHDILHFQFSDSITKYHVSNATLYVYVKGAERRPVPASFHLEVFKVYKGTDHGDAPGLHKVSARKISQPQGRGDWVQVDVTTLVSEWFKNPRENLGFVISGNVNGKKVIATETALDNSASRTVPYVEITTREAKRRTKRNLGLNCDEKMNESVCCRYPLTVDFEEFGWDFIIAPKRYEAHYCSGECPYITLQKHAHTHILQMAQPNMATPCCAPRKMSSISMLYFDQQMNVVYGSLPGMVVDRCGCS